MNTYHYVVLLLDLFLVFWMFLELFVACFYKTRYLFSVIYWKSINDLNLYYSSNFDRKVILLHSDRVIYDYFWGQTVVSWTFAELLYGFLKLV